MLVKFLHSHGNQSRMCNPSAVMAIFYFTFFILSNFFQSLMIGSFIIFNWNLCRHSTYGKDASFMTALNDQLGIGIHERRGHGDLIAIWNNKIGMISEFFDIRENIIPTPTIQTNNMVFQFVNNFVQLKTC